MSTMSELESLITEYALADSPLRVWCKSGTWYVSVALTSGTLTCQGIDLASAMRNLIGLLQRLAQGRESAAVALSRATTRDTRRDTLDLPKVVQEIGP